MRYLFSLHVSVLEKKTTIIFENLVFLSKYLVEKFPRQLSNEREALLILDG
jgi:hypothetical protein